MNTQIEEMPQGFRKASVEVDSANFSVAIAGEIDPEKVQELLIKGLRYEAERNGLSKAYLALAGVDGKREGKKVLPPKFERKSVLFSEDGAETMRRALALAFEGLGSFRVVVGEFVSEEKAGGMKQATELFVKFSAAGKLAKLAATVDFEGEENEEGEYDKDAFILQIHASLFKK